MLRVAISALRARRTQSVMLVVLAALVTAAAVAAPFFVYASVEKLAARDIAAAPPNQRDVTVSNTVSLHDNGAAMIASQFGSIPNVLRVPGFTGVNSVRVLADIGPASGPAITYLSYREGVCGHVAVQGACPTQPGDTMVSAAAAGYANVRLGGVLTVTSSTYGAPLKLHVVGVYKPLDPAEPYWGSSTLAAQIQAQVPTGYRAADAVFVAESTVAATASSSATIDRDLALTDSTMTVSDSITTAQTIFNAANDAHGRGYTITSDFSDLSNKIVLDTNQIFINVPLGAAELVMFGWFALFFAIRATAQARRFDVGVLKLRGVQRRNLWKLMIEQSAVPLLVGLPIGLGLGFLGARAGAGPVASDDQPIALILAVVAAAVAVAGGLLAALVAERSALATPVGELLRSTPARRRAWKADVVDLILVVVAIAGVIQIHTSAAASDGTTLSALAPVLVAFATGLIAARLLAPLARRAIGSSRSAGRTRGLLTATYLARRPGLDRLFALVTIAVALCGYAVLAATTASQARTERSALEVGAARVVTVAAVNPTRLLAAVRAADPSGRYAMAATEIGGANDQGILAIDSSRLAAVVPAGTPGDSDPAALAALLRPQPAHDVSVTSPTLALTVDATALPAGPPPTDGAPPGAYEVITLIGPAGYAYATFGPLVPGIQTYSATVDACSAVRPCEVVGFQLAAGASKIISIMPPAPAGTSVVVTGLQQGDGGPVLDASQLAALSWRTTANPTAYGPVLAASPRGLAMSIQAEADEAALNPDPTAYVPSTPAVAPVVVAGPRPAASIPGFPTIAPFGFRSIPIRVAATRELLPRLERSGTLIDLDYAQALAGADNGAETPEVWLAPNAPPGIVAALEREGLTPSSTASIAAQTGQYAAEPAVVGQRFEVVAGLLAVGIAAAVLLLVASVECRPRARELVALRRQGVRSSVVRGTSFLVYGVLAGGAFVAGLIGAVIDRLLANSAPLFRDGWQILARPSVVPLPAFGLTVAITAITLGAAAFGAAYQVVRAQTVEAGQR